MAKLPRKGVLVEPDGTIVWGWHQPDDAPEPEGIPPILGLHTDQTPRFINSAEAIALDLENDMDADDLHDLLHEATLARCRKQADGSWKFTKVLQQRLEDGTVVEIEHAHPIEEKMRARAELKQKVLDAQAAKGKL